MKQYKEFQFGWWLFIVLIPIQIYFTYIYFSDPGDKPFDKNHPLIVNGVIFLIYLFFYGMTTKVDDKEIEISFGLGLIKKTIKVDKISHIDTVTNPWYYGWGIRLISNGWLYNISGTDGIELKFNDRKTIIRIGTKDSGKLRHEIKIRLSK